MARQNQLRKLAMRSTTVCIDHVYRFSSSVKTVQFPKMERDHSFARARDLLLGTVDSVLQLASTGSDNASGSTTSSQRSGTISNI